MQRKSELPQSVAVEGNDLPDYMFPVNRFEIKELLDRAKYLGRELKEIIIFVTLSMLLLIGISLLPESPVPVTGATATAAATLTSIVNETHTVNGSLKGNQEQY